MKTLLTPKLDFVFKKLFAEDVDILIDLINSVLKLPQRVCSVKVKNPMILPEEITKKYVILDVRAIDEQGNHYDIEIQVRRFNSYSKRTLYYVSKIYSEQLDSGENYEELKPVIGIHFLDYQLYPKYSEFHFCFEMREREHHELCLTEDMVIHIIELQKYEKQFKKRIKAMDVNIKPMEKDSLDEWIHFFNHAHEQGDQSMRTQYQNPMVQKAFKALEALSADEKTRQLAEMREKALKNETSELQAAMRRGLEKGVKKGIKEGKAEGKAEGIREMAKSMILRGMDDEVIADITGMNASEIAEIKKQISY